MSKKPSKPAPKKQSKSPKSKVPSKPVAAKPVDSTDAIVRVEAQKHLGPAASLAVRANALVVNSEAAITDATGLLGDLKRAREGLENQRGFFTKPLREHVKRIEDLFRPVLKQLEEADEKLRERTAKFIDDRKAEAQKAADELAAKSMAAAEKGQDTKAADLALKSAEAIEAGTTRVVVADNSSLSTRTATEYEIEDMGKVPKEYLTLDDKAVRSAIRSGVRDIPGLRIFDKTTLAVSAGAGAGAQA